MYFFKASEAKGIIASLIQLLKPKVRKNSKLLLKREKKPQVSCGSGFTQQIWRLNQHWQWLTLFSVHGDDERKFSTWEEDKKTPFMDSFFLLLLKAVVVQKVPRWIECAGVVNKALLNSHFMNWPMGPCPGVSAEGMKRSFPVQDRLWLVWLLRTLRERILLIPWQ